MGVRIGQLGRRLLVQRTHLGVIPICLCVYLACPLRYCDGHLLCDLEQVEEYRSELIGRGAQE